MLLRMRYGDVAVQLKTGLENMMFVQDKPLSDDVWGGGLFVQRR